MDFSRLSKIGSAYARAVVDLWENAPEHEKKRLERNGLTKDDVERFKGILIKNKPALYNLE